MEFTLEQLKTVFDKWDKQYSTIYMCFWECEIELNKFHYGDNLDDEVPQLRVGQETPNYDEEIEHLDGEEYSNYDYLSTKF